MNKQRSKLIAELSNDLPVTNRSGRTMDLVTMWLVLSTIMAAGLTWLTGPFRNGSLQQLFAHPQFMLESIVGVVAILLLCTAAIQSGIPGRYSRFRQFAPVLGVLILWIGFYVTGLWSPALEPSMTGMRPNPCYLETFFYGVPSLFLGFYFIRRLWPLHGGWSGLTIGLAAGAIPALIMQFACMYVPAHIITHHLLPGLLLGLVGYVAGRILLNK